jgi:hypothetical protein
MRDDAQNERISYDPKKIMRQIKVHWERLECTALWQFSKA